MSFVLYCGACAGRAIAVHVQFTVVENLDSQHSTSSNLEPCEVHSKHATLQIECLATYSSKTNRLMPICVLEYMVMSKRLWFSQQWSRRCSD